MIEIDRDLLESMLENTRALIAEWLWMEGTTHGDAVLAQMRDEVRQCEDLLDD